MRRSSMVWQLFFAHGLLIVLSLGLLGVAVSTWAERRELRQIEQQLRSKTVLLQEVVRGRKVEQIRKRLQALDREFAVRITLIAPDGAVLLESDRDDVQGMENHGERPEVQAARDARFGMATRRSTTLKTSMMYVAMQVDSPHPEIAFVRVAVPTDEVQVHVANLRNLVLGTAGLTALSALLVAWLVARWTARPLQELSQGASIIAAGGYGHKVYLNRRDEIGALATSFNNMSLRLAEQFAQLDRDRQQLRAVLGSMVEGVVAIDADQVVLFANERAGQLLDFPIPDAVGRRLWEVIRHRPANELVQRLMEAGDVASGEFEWPGDQRRYLSMRAAPLPGSPLRGGVLVFHDVTELRKLERVRQEFVANVSHELKTPLAAIQAMVETLLDGALQDPEHNVGFLGRIGENAERLRRLVQDLLSLGRIEAGEEALRIQRVDLGEAVDACLARHREQARSKGLRLEAAPPPQPVAVMADEEALDQILDNLVDNAIKYTQTGGITLRWSGDDSTAVVLVEDTGPGIPDKDLPRIFERFYRVDKARSREVGGTGLGLSIVKHLAGALGGSIAASSQVGKGSIFRLQLPRAVE